MVVTLRLIVVLTRWL